MEESVTVDHLVFEYQAEMSRQRDEEYDVGRDVKGKEVVGDHEQGESGDGIRMRHR